MQAFLHSSSDNLFFRVPLLEPETLTKAPSSTPLVAQIGGKRKRTDGEAEAAAKAAKKQRADTTEGNVPPAQFRPTRRRGRTKRSQGSKEEEEEEECGRAESADKVPPAPPEEGAVHRLSDENEEREGLKNF